MKLNIPIQILIAVLLGSLMGFFFPFDELHFLSEIGKVIIHWIKIIAGPFLFLSILISVIQVDLNWSHGVRVLTIALINSICALIIAMTLSTIFFKNSSLPKQSDNQNIQINQAQSKLQTQAQTQAQDVKLGAQEFVNNLMPKSFFSPFVANDILWVALLGLILGVAIRLNVNLSVETKRGLVFILENFQSTMGLILMWLLKVIPLAVFSIIAATVSRYGFFVFVGLSEFVLIVSLGFILQIVLVYGFWIFIIAKKSWNEVLSAIKVPVFYAFGVNSSLATLPLTLKALKNLKVSEASSSLGAGVATNLNNDGIILYEAMAIIFISFAYGLPVDFQQMLIIAMTCMVASLGITGVPEAGFISLSVIVGVLGLPLEALPLLLSVDWILARFRSVVNVLSDITLSVALDSKFNSENKEVF